MNLALMLMLLGASFISAVSHAQSISPPTLSGTPPSSVIVGLAYAFTPTVTVSEGQSYTLSISNMPTWASFDSVTGRLAGTPTASDVGTYSGIRILLRSGQYIVSLPQFSITVVPNIPPTLSGTPLASVTVGKSYSFRPTASDPEGRALKFTIANKPAWASFASTTGRLYGTPGSTRVGTYSGIRISVSDGQSTVTLPAFSITVAAVTYGSATVSWSPPTYYVDGTPLKDLAGYRIVYGLSPSDLSKSVDIPSPAITSALIEALTTGTWYFAVKAYTTASIESDLSTVGYKIIN